MRGFHLIPDADIRPIDALMLRPDGQLNVVPAWKLQEFPHTDLQVWCVKRGVYQFPTEELLNWLSERIAGRKAIEICAGNGVLGRELGIASTDSYLHTKPEIIAYYELMRQAPCKPGPDVHQFEANQAVSRFKPDVVIGAWVTQRWQSGDQYGSAEGVDEIKLAERVSTYIHIGHDSTHADKRIMQRPHELLRPEWLVSRGTDQSLNHVAAWGQSDSEAK